MCVFRATKLNIALIFALLLGSTAVFAQTSKGTLTGVARDQTGAAIPNASVTIKDEATGAVRQGKTGADGSYRFDALDPAPYTIDVVASGFTRYEAKDVQVRSTVDTSFDVKLLIGKTQDTVTVEADQATIDTENGQLSGVIGSAELAKTPIFSLNPVELALTVPGVQPVANGVGAFENGIDIQVNGARPRSNNFLLDGQEINDVGITGQAFQPQIPDIFASVNVITNSASAEFGRAGGGIVNLVTKSGTNQFHGTVFERYTSAGLDSVPGNERGTGFVNARQSEHSYGFTAGGPIIKNKLFAFGAWELQRFFGQEVPGINLLPDAAGYATLQTITGDPATQVALFDQYLNNGSYLTQDKEYTGGTSKNVGALPGCPATGCVITFAGFQRPFAALNEPDTQWEYRIDYRPWEKDSFAFRYLHDRTSLNPDFFNNPLALTGFDTLQGGPSELGAGTWTHVFTSRLLNEFRTSEARINFQFAPTPATLVNPLYALPTITLGNISGTTTGGTATFPALGPNQNFPQGREEDLYQFQDTVSYTKGRQTFRIGTDIGRLIEIDLVSQNAKGTLGFNDGGNASTSLGNFLINQLGASGSATRVFGPTRADSHGYRNGIFAQDDIKFSPDLTVNIGIRWDYLSNPENSIPYPGVDPNNPLAPIPTLVRVQNDYHNFGPRLGFAYNPHHILGFLGDGKTVVRGGFGIFYDSTFSNILVNSTQAAPVSASGLIQQIGTASPGPATGTGGLISQISPVISQRSTVESEASNLVNPITYQYNLGVERELPSQVTVTVRYVGNIGENLFANQQYNAPVNGVRGDTGRGAIILRGNYAASNYNGLEISGERNFRHGFLIRTNYTYSKDLSTGDDIFAGVGSPTSYGIDLQPGNRYREYGNSAFDHRHFFSISYVWSPKGLRAENAFTNAALGVLTRYWTVSGTSQLQSGGYTSISTNGLDINNDLSSSNDRPVVSNISAPLTSVGIDGAYLGGTAGTYYDLAANNTTGALNPAQASAFHFLVPVGTTFQYLNQTIGRDSYRTPGTTTHNIALEKGIGLSYLHFKQGRLILRTEVQNLFNHNDSLTADSDALDAGVGFLDKTRIGSQRVVLLWAKIEF